MSKRTPAIGTPEFLNFFVSKFRVSDQCWCWIGGTISRIRPYGRIRVNGRLILAHRISYQLFKGNVPAEASVCHTCDNPSCVRPAHLFLGTHSDNIRDMYQKGRGNRPKGDSWQRIHAHEDRRGSMNGRSKLTEELVREIRFRGLREPQGDLAREFNVSQVLISQILLGKIWRHVI